MILRTIKSGRLLAVHPGFATIQELLKGKYWYYYNWSWQSGQLVFVLKTVSYSYRKKSLGPRTDHRNRFAYLGKRENAKAEETMNSGLPINNLIIRSHTYLKTMAFKT